MPAEFAPRQYQKGLSYVVGWCSCLGWLAGIPSTAIQLAGIVQEMILLTHPDANITTLWQTTLLVFVFVFLVVGFNIFFAHHLPLAEGIVLFVHIFGFFVRPTLDICSESLTDLQPGICMHLVDNGRARAGITGVHYFPVKYLILSSE